jgi:hypothetical protein
LPGNGFRYFGDGGVAGDDVQPGAGEPAGWLGVTAGLVPVAHPGWVAIGCVVMVDGVRVALALSGATVPLGPVVCDGV